MKKFSASVLYIILAAGILCILAGLILPVVVFSAQPVSLFNRWPALLLLGGILVYIALAFSHHAYQLFLGMNFCFLGFLMFVIKADFMTVSFRAVWPLCVIFSGLSLVPSGYFRYRTMRTVYLFPAVILVFLGMFFCLFSFHIIRMPLRKFIAIWWPAALICVGTILIGIFLYQKNCKASFPYLKDGIIENDSDDADFCDDSNGERK